MAHRFKHVLAILTTALFSTNAAAQISIPFPSPPNPVELLSALDNLYRSDSPPVPLPAQRVIDESVSEMFGENSKELRRPIRLWIAELGLAIAADEAVVEHDRLTVRFTNVSFACLNSAPQIFASETGVVRVEQPLTHSKELLQANVLKAQLLSKSRTIHFGWSGRPIGITSAAPRSTTLQIRFEFAFDPFLPASDLVPLVPQSKAIAKAPRHLSHGMGVELDAVREIEFAASMAPDLAKSQSMAVTAHSAAKINYLDAKSKGGFIRALIDNRADLRGLPFMLDENCRTTENQAAMFALNAESIRSALFVANIDPAKALGIDYWFAAVRKLEGERGASRFRATRADQARSQQALVAAFVQILAPESESIRVDLAKCLATLQHVDATKALARLAIFAPEDDVRAAAIEGLTLRRERDYTDVLVQGLNYPLPAVARRAVETIVKLDRKDLLVDVIQMLERPDPRQPITAVQDGRPMATVREVIKINHHRNCLLCHPPGNTAAIPDGALRIAMPLAMQPLSNSSLTGYNQQTPVTPDILVRIDMTYLRQDFSLMLPVADAHPWPEMQRFDFLVRQRELTPLEVKAYESLTAAEPGRLSPYHRAALFALRELTGRDTEPTAAAWRKLLRLQKTS